MRIALFHSPRLRWIFLGPNGIRAGWSVLIFLMAMMLPALAIGLAAHHWHLVPDHKHTMLRPLMLVVQEGLTLALIAFATAVMAWIERRSIWSYGMALRRVGADFGIGWLGGFLCLSVLVAALAGGGFLVFDGESLHGAAVLGYGAIWFVGFLLVGLVEETLFRGYVLATFARGMGFWPAAAATSLLFGAAHLPNKGETALGLAAVVAAGLVFCLLLRAAGSLWMAIGFHAAWDWAQSYLYGTPDSAMLAEGHLFLSHAAGDPRLSGGLDGPEGSLLAAPVMIVGLLALVWVCRRPAFRVGGTRVAAE